MPANDYPDYSIPKMVKSIVSAATDDRPDLIVATVTATSPLTIKFANASSISGGSVKRLSSYTATIGDTVLVARAGYRYYVIGKVV